MPEKLSRNVARCHDFESDVDHFQGGPVPVPDEIVDEPGTRPYVLLVRRIGDAGTIGDEFQGPFDLGNEGLGN